MRLDRARRWSIRLVCLSGLITLVATSPYDKLVSVVAAKQDQLSVGESEVRIRIRMPRPSPSTGTDQGWVTVTPGSDQLDAPLKFNVVRDGGPGDAGTGWELEQRPLDPALAAPPDAAFSFVDPTGSPADASIPLCDVLPCSGWDLILRIPEDVDVTVPDFYPVTFQITVSLISRDPGTGWCFTSKSYDPYYHDPDSIHIAVHH